MNNYNPYLSQRISMLYRYGQSYIAKRVRAFNIGTSHFAVLLMLYRKDRINQDQISKFLKLDKAAITKSVTYLENEGYIKREISKLDKRAYEVILTQKAFDIKDNLYEILHEWENKILQDISIEEQELFQTILKKISDSVTDSE